MPKLTSSMMPIPCRQRGIAIVEFAIALPLMLLLMLATAEFGRALYQYNTLTKAVRDGTRYLSNHVLPDSSGIIAICNPVAATTRNLVIYGRINNSGSPLIQEFNPASAEDDLRIGCSSGDSAMPAAPAIICPVGGGVLCPDPGDEYVRVSATYQYEPMLFPNTLPTFGLSDPVDLKMPMSASVTMRALK